MKLINDIKSVFNVLTDRPNPKKIKALNFAVTYLCNSRCIICNIWKRYQENPRKLADELKLEQIEKIFSESRYLNNLQSISLTGGEPFLRRDFVELCGFFIKKYPRAEIGISTNGVEPELILSKLGDIIKWFFPKKLGVSLSLDGIAESTHDRIRQAPGNYKNALIVANSIKKRYPAINLGLGFTIIPTNYEELPKVHNLSKTLGIGFGFQFAHASAGYYNNLERKDSEFKWNEQQLKKLEETIHQITQDYRRLRTSFFQKFLSYATVNDVATYYFKGMVPFQRDYRRRWPCYSGTSSLFMDPYGDVYPCIMLNRKIGNAQGDFNKTWSAQEAQRIRKFIEQKRCSCWTPCESFNSLSRNLKVPFLNFYRTIRGK